MNCRHCGALLEQTFVDLGYAPPSNAYLSKEDLTRPETYFPLRVMVCHECWLVQTEDHARADELFTDDYAYFSSTSSTWLAHAQLYAETIIERLSLDSQSFVVEVASNDGYLLRNFLQANIPCLGIEPTVSTATIAEDQGIPVLKEFFTEPFAQSVVSHYGRADLVVANNVYAHVPDINDFTRGIAALLKPEGVVTLEFPHLMNLIKYCQFDTIYHEHYSYLSLGVVQRIFGLCGLKIWDVETTETHGGSLRIFGAHHSSSWKTTNRVASLMASEEEAGLSTRETFNGFQPSVDRARDDFLNFLLLEKELGNRTAGFGAAAKANTLLNFAQVTNALLVSVYDNALSKQNKFLPGSHIPILPPAQLLTDGIDNIVVFAWNLIDEILEELKQLGFEGSVFTVLPRLTKHNL